MATVAISTQARERRYASEDGPSYRNHYLLNPNFHDREPGIYDEPCAFIVGVLNAGGVIHPHFHKVDQFQVVVAGDGTIGKHPLKPITVHYTDAYTPYGPIVAGPKGLHFFTIRMQTDFTGFHRMPEARHEMKGKAGRTATCEAVAEPSSTLYRKDAAIETLLAPSDDGVGAFLLRAGPEVEAAAPDPKGTGGQIHVVTGGSAIHKGQELPLWSCIHVSDNEGPLALRGGPSGLELLVLQFAQKRK